MCINCWKERGSPHISTPDVLIAAYRIKDVYRYEGAGGYLHIMIDDWNLEDGHIEFCERQILENPFNLETESLQAQMTCLRVLERLSEQERASALGLHDGFWGPEG